jgi:Domain of unknown function (DUF4410)
MSAGSSRKTLLVVLVWAACGGLSACAHSLTAKEAQAPTTKIRTVAIGALATGDLHREREVRRFRRALIARLEDSQAFSRVLSPAPERLPKGAVRVTGAFEVLSDGSESMRLIVGYGFGAPHVRATFEIADSSGRRLAAFEETARSFDGTGYAAHWDAADLDDVVDDFADRTAMAIVRWSQGEDIESSMWSFLE